MNINKINKWITIVFISACIFISIILVEAVILALINQFKIVYLYFALIPAFIIAIYSTFVIKRDINIFPKISFLVLIIFIILSLIMIFYPHDTFGGRDESLYSNYAVHLVKNGSLILPSYLNNLPGNSIENVRTTPIGYTIYLALQKIFFGTQGLLRANVIILFFGLFSLYLISTYLGGKKVGLLTTILYSSSMPFLWFSRETMSENLSFFLLWSIILFLLFYLKSKNYFYLIFVFIFSWLFSFTRFEGFLLQFVLLFIVPFLLLLKKINYKQIITVTIIYLLILISSIFISKNIFLSGYFNTIVPQVVVNIKKDVSSLIPKNISYNDKYNYYANLNNDTLPNRFPIFVYNMMAKYNFVLILFSIVLVTIYLILRHKELDKSKKFLFIILILLLPEYYKIISPNVTLDQPWLYRRYVYALLPFGYMCIIFFLNNFKNKNIFIIMSSLLFLINISLSSQIIFLKSNWTLIDKLSKVTKIISQNDFVIIKDKPLNYYSPIAYLLLNKGVRSAQSSTIWLQQFTPEEKVFNGIPYNRIYLLSSDEIYYYNLLTRKLMDKEHYASFDIISRKSVDVKYDQVVPSCQLYLLGAEEGLSDPYNIGIISFSSVKKYCKKPINEITKNQGKLYLYELIYKTEENE